MFQSIVFSVLLFTIANVELTTSFPSDNATEVSVRDHNSYDSSPSGTPRQEGAPDQIRYTLGYRQTDDERVYQHSNNDIYMYLEKENLQLSLWYSGCARGETITFVEITVRQGSREGHGYVTSGGIGECYINVIVEVYKTDYIGYAVDVYSKK